mmetsp:Transcript_39534/g.93413  ORF Transcript_39534/g.93413 Transcript_39534/m.93413 type:complete len:217 (+) Transcript_39534:161-811(+)
MSVGIAARVHTARSLKASINPPGFARDGAASGRRPAHRFPMASHLSISTDARPSAPENAGTGRTRCEAFSGGRAPDIVCAGAPSLVCPEKRARYVEVETRPRAVMVRLRRSSFPAARTSEARPSPVTYPSCKSANHHVASSCISGSTGADSSRRTGVAAFNAPPLRTVKSTAPSSHDHAGISHESASLLSISAMLLISSPPPRDHRHQYCTAWLNP